MKKYIIWLLLPFLLLLSCQKEEGASVETGSLVVFASQNHEVSVQTKASVADMPISIAICEASTGDTIEFFESYEDLGGNKVDLTVGKYYVKASTLAGEDVAFDNPFYYGVDTVQVRAGHIVEAEVECFLANTKVTVIYSSKVREFFTSYKTTVSNSSGSLVFDENEKKAGYYIPEKLYVVLDLVNVDGTPYRVTRELPNVKAQEHYRLSFSVDEKPVNPEAGADFEVTVDETTKDIVCVLTIPIFEDNEGRNMPIIKSSSNCLNIKESNPSTDTLTSLITAEHGVSVVALKLISPYFNTDLGLPKYIDLMTASESMQTALNAIGINEIADVTSGMTIDFNTLLDRLPTSADNTTSIAHTIGLLVRDSLGQQVEETIIVNVRPNKAIEINVNAWSRYVNISAVLETNIEVTLQYRAKGLGAWTPLTIESSDLTSNDEGGFILNKKIPELTAATTYEYEIAAGLDNVPGEFTTAAETPLINGSFEDWGTHEGRNGVVVPRKEGHDFWDCGNTKIAGVNADFTRPRDPGRDNVGKAAQLYSKYAGLGGSLGAFGAGNAFTGNFNLDGMDGELNLGRPYTSRPTALKGYYKYTSANVNYVSEHVPHLKEGGKDSCAIYIALTTGIIEVRTVSQKVFDKNDPSIIAFAELSKAESCTTAGTDYVEFNLPLVYRDLVTLPTHIIIVCSSSKYGDFFAGGEGSTLLIDDFVLDFSGEPKTAE